jgi:hypothetical protein
MAGQFEIVESGVLLFAWEGTLSREEFIQAAYERKKFADAHHPSDYVLIYDLRKAVVTTLDIRLSRWAVEVDPRMIHVVIVGKPLIVQAVVNVLANLLRTKIEFAGSMEEGLQFARTALERKRPLN